VRGRGRPRWTQRHLLARGGHLRGWSGVHRSSPTRSVSSSSRTHP
jgi:hypothetical protein